MTMTNQEAVTPEVAQASDRYIEALKAQQDAKTNLDNLNTSLTTWRKAFDDAKKILDQAKPAITIAKAQLQKADADVTLARAALAALAPEKVANTSTKGADQSTVQGAVRDILRGAGPEGLTLDDIYARLQAGGVTMAGTDPRKNLTSYIARWSKVGGSGIKSTGRGLYGFDGPTTEAPAAVPSFLAPAPENTVEASAHVVVEPVTVLEATETFVAPEVPGFLTPASQENVQVEVGAALPEGFPGRAALVEAGFGTTESLAEKTFDQLRRIKGVGAETARNILAALGRSEA